MLKRIAFEEGVELLKHASSEELQQRAQAVRAEKNPPKRVTFVLDSNPNYTNVCNVGCSFCAFYRHPEAKGAYTKTVEEVMDHMERAKKAGLTTVLLQGGVNNALPLEYYVDLVKTARKRYPEIHPHFFSAVELDNLAQISSITIRQVLENLWEAGLRTIPGGGSEILSERVRLKISPKKLGPDRWIQFHHTAHQIGYRTTATMMYGHIEEPEDIVTHLETLRAHQDIIPGFTSFIPWSYKRDRTALRRTVKSWVGSDAYYRILAFARIYLDNFDHISASWFGEGKEIGMKALSYGADDFGGTVMEESVHRATGWINYATHDEMVEMIRQAGFVPAQRDTLYRILRTYEPCEATV